jgi:hypothetical protein
MLTCYFSFQAVDTASTTARIVSVLKKTLKTKQSDDKDVKVYMKKNSINKGDLGNRKSYDSKIELNTSSKNNGFYDNIPLQEIENKSSEDISYNLVKQLEDRSNFDEMDNQEIEVNNTSTNNELDLLSTFLLPVNGQVLSTDQWYSLTGGSQKDLKNFRKEFNKMIYSSELRSALGINYSDLMKSEKAIMAIASDLYKVLSVINYIEINNLINLYKIDVERIGFIAQIFNDFINNSKNNGFSIFIEEFFSFAQNLVNEDMINFSNKFINKILTTGQYDKESLNLILKFATYAGENIVWTISIISKAIEENIKRNPILKEKLLLVKQNLSTINTKRGLINEIGRLVDDDVFFENFAIILNNVINNIPQVGLPILEAINN